LTFNETIILIFVIKSIKGNILKSVEIVLENKGKFIVDKTDILFIILPKEAL